METAVLFSAEEVQEIHVQLERAHKAIATVERILTNAPRAAVGSALDAEKQGIDRSMVAAKSLTDNY